MFLKFDREDSNINSYLIEMKNKKLKYWLVSWSVGLKKFVPGTLFHSAYQKRYKPFSIENSINITSHISLNCISSFP